MPHLAPALLCASLLVHGTGLDDPTLEAENGLIKMATEVMVTMAMMVVMVTMMSVMVMEPRTGCKGAQHR